MKRGLLIVISAPSGTGKSTLVRVLREAMPELEYSISVTTRPPRRGEKNGVDYIFVNKEKFDEMVKNDEFIEHATVFDNCYGTQKSAIDHAISEGKGIVLDVDIQGAIQIKREHDGIFIFIIPPSLNILEDRLRKRNTDDETEIVKRIARAKEEIANYVNYDYVIYNETISDSIQKLKAIIAAEKCRTLRNKSILEEFGIK